MPDVVMDGMKTVMGSTARMTQEDNMIGDCFILDRTHVQITVGVLLQEIKHSYSALNPKSL